MSRADRYLQSLLEDLDHISGRIEKVRLGKVRKVDCYAIAVDNIKRQLDGVKGALRLAIIPEEE